MNIQSDPFKTAGVYTDLHNLNSIKVQAQKDEGAALKEVARQFESMFVNMMMKSMRDANKVFEEGNLLKSNESEFYQQMFDNQLALTLAQGKGIGLAESLYQQMSANYGIKEETESEPRKPKTIQDYPRTEQIQRAVRMVDAMVEIDRLVQEKPAPDPIIDTPDERDFAHWQPIIESAATNASSEPGDGNLPLVNSMPLEFKTPEEFVEALYPIARKVEAETGMDARFLLAQSALETGWGKHMITGSQSEPSFNLFGIKADTRWMGDKVNITTTEFRDNTPVKEKAAFRAYAGYEHSFRDYVDFLKNNPRYKDATQYFSKPEDLARELQDAGYATDPAYSAKIQRIFNSDLLTSAMKGNRS